MIARARSIDLGYLTQLSLPVSLAAFAWAMVHVDVNVKSGSSERMSWAVTVGPS